MVGFVSPPVLTLTSLKPTVSITIGVDTGAVAAAGEGPITSGVYMMDNKIRNGSTNEGQINLHTNCNVTALIGFQALPINAAGSGSDTVKIKSFALVSGDDVVYRRGPSDPDQIPACRFAARRILDWPGHGGGNRNLPN